jgi:hypothetical protein
VVPAEEVQVLEKEKDMHIMPFQRPHPHHQEDHV